MEERIFRPNLISFSGYWIPISLLVLFFIFIYIKTGILLYLLAPILFEVVTTIYLFIFWRGTYLKINNQKLIFKKPFNKLQEIDLSEISVKRRGYMYSTGAGGSPTNYLWANLELILKNGSKKILSGYFSPKQIVGMLYALDEMHNKN